MTDKDFTGFLIDRGLTVAGSGETMYDLEKRFGRGRWYDFLDVVRLPPARLFPELTEPFFLLTHPTCLLPPSDLECDFNLHRNAAGTFACALERLTGVFGPAEPGTSVNTLSASWTFERMSLSILTFVREKTRGGNPLYARHPELWDLCRISVHRDWVREGSDVGHVGPTMAIDSAFWRSGRDLMPWDRGLLFRTPSLAPPFLWKQAAEIGWHAAPWAGTFERSQCLGLRLERVLPARSSGRSSLSLALRNPFSLEREPVNSTILTGSETETLDGVAPRMATFWELPLNVQQYEAD